MNAGTATINWLYEKQLRIDADWSEREPQGFTWWADRSAQRIEVVRSDHDSELGESFLIRVRTDLLEGVELNERALIVIGSMIMPFASMSGPVYNAATRRLSLCSIVRVHDGIREWMAPLISLSAALQVGEARIMGPQLPTLLPGTRFAVSGHPKRGLRPKPDEMAELISTLIVPHGKASPPLTESDFTGAVKSLMMRPPSLGATADKSGLTVEFPYGDSSSLCQMTIAEKHPRYGRGLHLRQSFPVEIGSEIDGIQLSLDLNAQELAEDPAGYGLGSYCYRADTIHFCSFWPNVCLRKGLIENLYWGCANRAQRMSHRFRGDDWSNL
jgi:hypothetical protein